MSTRPQLPPHIRTALRRLAGPFVAAVRYPGLRLASTRSFEVVDVPSSVAPALTQFDGVQLPVDGDGPGLVRRYAITISRPRMSAAQLIAAFADRPNDFAPTEYAVFEDPSGDGTDTALRLHSDVLVRITGPYDGPVRIVDVDDSHVRLQTRSGHIEAGQIVFQAQQDGADVQFTITSWSRNAGLDLSVLWWSGLAYELQTIMWTHVCRRAAVVAGGDASKVSIRTETLDGADLDLLGTVTVL
jgi:hypothetical protein